MGLSNDGVKLNWLMLSLDEKMMKVFWIHDKHNNNNSNEDDSLSWEEEYEVSEYMHFV